MEKNHLGRVILVILVVMGKVSWFNGGAGGDSEGVTPVTIPNTAVKPFDVDGTTLLRWESRTLPAFFLFFARVWLWYWE